MKCYTVIDSYSLGDTPYMWVANYNTREDAIKCFESLLHHLCFIDKNGKVFNGDDSEVVVEELFEDVLANGHGYHYDICGGFGEIFLRAEKIQDKFDPNQMPFD